MNIYNSFRMASPNALSKKQYMYILTNVFSLSTETVLKTYNFGNQYCQFLVLFIQQSILILGNATNQYF